MPKRQNSARPRARKAPAAVRRQIARGEPIDYKALMAWWANGCAPHLRHLSPHVAAVASAAPHPSRALSTHAHIRWIP